jgi:hypothetical protein
MKYIGRIANLAAPMLALLLGFGLLFLSTAPVHAGGFCTGEPGECDDGNPCTDDSCELKECFHVNNTAPCDDGKFCTSGDACDDGLCRGARTCHDDNPCTTDACNEAEDMCSHVNNDLPCNDLNPCTEDDQCSDGACVGEESPGCGCPLCGNFIKGDDCELTAGDALGVLKASVGLEECGPAVCDYNGNGEITAADALAVLRTAVGQPVEPKCPPGSTSTTVTTLL